MQLTTIFPMFFLDRHVSAQCVGREDPDVFMCMFAHLEAGVCTLFLTYEIMSVCNFKHITPCLSHNFPQVHTKQTTTSRRFNLLYRKNCIQSVQCCIS